VRHCVARSELRRQPLGRRDAFAAAVLAGITVVVFLRALDCGFINFDDTSYVTDNKHVTTGLTLAGAGWAFTAYTPIYWQPLTWLSLQLDSSLWWPKPWGFLLTNLLLHAANAALLFVALRSLTAVFWRSAAAALFFAVHPLRVESIAWVTERKDVLSGFFGLLALCAYAAYAHRPSPRRYLVVATAFALSLMAKPMLVTLPCLLLVLDWWPLDRLRPAGRTAWLSVLEKLPLMALAAASCVVTLLAHREEGGWPGLHGLRLTGRVENAAVSDALYLFKTVWPVDLAVYYPHPLLGYNKVDHLPARQVVAAALLLAAATYGAVALRRRAPYLAAGWAWYLVALMPVIGLVQSGAQGYADRFTYFPQIGILVAACWGVADLARGRAPLALKAAAALAAVLAAVSWNQLSYWRDPVTLWRHALAATGPNPIALQNLADYLPDDEAARYLRQAIDLDPDGADAGVSSDAHAKLGNIYLRAGRLDDATREQEAAARISPNMEGAYCNLGIIALRRGLYDRAADYFRRQIGLRDTAAARCNLGAALKYRGNLDGAEKEFRAAVCLDPDFASARANLGGLLQRRHRLDEAALEEQKAIELAPGMYEAHYQLAMIEMDRGNYARAVECFRTALRLRPGSFDAFSGLGTAQLQQGRVDEAVAVLSEVVHGRPQDGPARLNLGKVLEQRGDLEAAAFQYEAATKLVPDLAQAWYDLGRLRALQGRQGEAIASFEQAATLDSASDVYRKALEAARQQQSHSRASGGGAAPR
jgi:tetratricopeptide (TPR) repeat protein